MSPTIISTKFMVISDTHGLDIHDNEAHPFRLPLPKVDVLLHCGDFTQVGGHKAFQNALRMMSNIDAELKLVIAGNHDLELDAEYWQTHLDEEAGDEPEEHDQAVAIMTGPLAKEARVTYLEEGTYSFTLQNGARFTIYASPYSPSFGDWAFGYSNTQDRFNDSEAKNPVPDHVDIFMTHGPPKDILDCCPSGNVGCDKIRTALERTKPLMHCFGHIHEGAGAQLITWDDEGGMEGTKVVGLQKGERWTYKDASDLQRKRNTLAINAAIQGDNGEFCNPPWIVQVSLAKQ